MNRNFLMAAAAAAMTVLLTSSAFATETRINSLSGSEKQFTIKDQSNSYLLPQMLVFFGNQVDVDNTHGADYGTMNVRYKLTDEAVLLVYGKRPKGQPLATRGALFPAAAGGANSAASVSGYASGAIENTSQQFGAGFATLVGDGLRLGATLEIGGRRADGPAGTTENNNTYFGVNLGLGIEINETNNLDFGLSFDFGTFTDIQTVPGGAPLEYFIASGIYNIGLLAKGSFQVHQIANLVPYAQLKYSGVGITHAPTAAVGGALDPTSGITGNLSRTYIRLGADLAITPVEGVLIQPGVGLGITTAVVSGTSTGAANTNATIEDSSLLQPYYGFAAEAAAFDWLDFRLGARQTVERRARNNTQPTNAPSNEATVTETATTVTTGIGVKLRSWTIDVNMNPAWFNNGPFLVTGNATPGWGLDFAARYEW